MSATDAARDEPALSIDVNSDLGEGYGAWSFGDDAAMLALVTSANIACGFHAGDPATILRTLQAAAARSVVVGAHLAYPDLAGFGRRFVDVGPADLFADSAYQLGALIALARVAGTEVRYVKPHGALYNRIVVDPVQSDAVADAVAAVDPGLAVLGLGGEIERSCRERGLRFEREAFPDRGYLPDGTLAPRAAAGALVTDPAEVAERAVAMARGVVVCIDGSVLPVAPASLCLHGDSPSAVASGRAVRAALADGGVEVRPFLPMGSG
ncbi:LamB/YcsF family protein [Naasia sp. SYSU D00948]|uniref:LamB/YcsF family protein n=1 Tax=Naasia sp. SYSU D00948 TaxID=2817379 RepID=UPI001B3036E9|nr:5-oxoprolinase subunit PxpA [Naasia sp. SYSU D00948]